MPGRRRGGAIGCLVLAGCLGGTTEPVTAPLPEGAHVEVTALRGHVVVHRPLGDSLAPETCAVRSIGGRIARTSGDTLWFRTVERFEPVDDTAPNGCARPATAMVVAVGDSVQVRRIVPVSAPKQILGTAILWAAIGGALLLIVSGADGLIDAVGRWF